MYASRITTFLSKCVLSTLASCQTKRLSILMSRRKEWSHKNTDSRAKTSLSHRRWDNNRWFTSSFPRKAKTCMAMDNLLSSSSSNKTKDTMALTSKLTSSKPKTTTTEWQMNSSANLKIVIKSSDPPLTHIDHSHLFFAKLLLFFIFIEDSSILVFMFFDFTLDELQIALLDE